MSQGRSILFFYCALGASSARNEKRLAVASVNQGIIAPLAFHQNLTPRFWSGKVTKSRLSAKKTLSIRGGTGLGSTH
jgi:hypothetical protein